MTHLEDIDIEDIYDRAAFSGGVIANMVADSLSASSDAGNFVYSSKSTEGIVIRVSGGAKLTYGSFRVSMSSTSIPINNPNPVKEALLRRIDAVSDDPELYEDGEPVPDPATKNIAKEMIRSIYPSGYLVGADVYAYYGAIHISWQTARKKVKLIVPASRRNVRPSIYHGQMQHGKVTKSATEADATSALLLRWLQWLPE
jgi:hypothetical protein